MEKYVQNNELLINSFNKEAHKYDNDTSDFGNKIVDYVNLENIKENLPPPDKNIALLDLGGGTGKYSLIFSKLGYKTTLVDISGEMLRVAEQKFKQENVSVSIFNTSGEELPFNDGCFNVIIMIGGVMSYTPNPHKLLMECKRVLKIDGIMYFDFLNTFGFCNEVGEINFRIEIAEAKEKLIQMSDWDYPVHLFNYKCIEEMIIKNKFKITKKYGTLVLSTSLPLDVRCGNDYDKNLFERYKKIELELSRNENYFGMASLCSICVVK